MKTWGLLRIGINIRECSLQFPPALRRHRPPVMKNETKPKTNTPHDGRSVTLLCAH